MPKITQPANPARPISIAGLAERLGVPRQRVYNLVKRGRIKAVPYSGGLIIQPEEAARVLDAAVRIDTRKGRESDRVRLDLKLNA